MLYVTSNRTNEVAKKIGVPYASFKILHTSRKFWCWRIIGRKVEELIWCVPLSNI